MTTRHASRRSLALAALAACLSLCGSFAAAQGTTRTKPLVTPRFRLDLPEKDWRAIPGGVNTLATLVYKDGAASIVVEQEVLQIALGPEEIDDNFMQLEVGAIQDREVGGKGFAGRLIGRGRQPVVVVDYQRQGASGPEKVRVFVTVTGQRLNRLVCAASPVLFSKVESTFGQVSTSFRPVEQSK